MSANNTSRQVICYSVHDQDCVRDMYMGRLRATLYVSAWNIGKVSTPRPITQSQRVALAEFHEGSHELHVIGSLS